jgi:Family of unknown function (DUF6131)
MIILGIIFLIIAAFVAKLAVLWTIGLILIAVGLILVVVSALGHPVGGRRHWF